MRYPEFWHLYLRAHARPATRGLHYIGTLLAVACLVAAVAVDWRFVVLAPIIGYGLAWVAHYRLEHNRPQTFGHPLWSLASDVRMLVLAVSGRLCPHLDRAGLAENSRR
jgi:hypothetical protein